MEDRPQCMATTKKNRRCKRSAMHGSAYCSLHAKLVGRDQPVVRQTLNRQGVLNMLAEQGDANGLDLSYTDISWARLGSSQTPMPDLSSVIFGKYGDVRSGVIAEHTMFQRSNLRAARFLYANLRHARFYRTDLTGADLRFSDLSGADLVETKLTGANLFGARLQDANLLNVRLQQADLYRARLSGKTNLRRTSIGKRILQEDSIAYRSFIESAVVPDSQHPLEHHMRDRLLKAKEIYESLRMHFTENGYLDDARWAYLRERRMGKMWKGQQARMAWRGKDRRRAFDLLQKCVVDWFVELLCDYGESVWRVIGWILALLFVIGPISVALLGGLSWTGQNSIVYSELPATWQMYLYSYFQYLLYMLDTLTTASFAELAPNTDAVRVLSGLMSVIGIFLVGLLGFVAGNRIRSSGV